MTNQIILDRKSEIRFLEVTDVFFISFPTQKGGWPKDGQYKFTFTSIDEDEDIDSEEEYYDEEEIYSDFEMKPPLEEDDAPDFLMELSSCANHLQNEILSNLLVLNQENRFPYLYRLKKILDDHKILLERFDNSAFSIQFGFEGKIIANKKYITDISIGKKNAVLEVMNFIDFHIDIENELKAEDIPRYEFEAATQKIAWLNELGIIEIILNRTKEKNSYNWTKAAKVIQSFTDLRFDLIRQCITAMYQPNESNKKNNPFNNINNKLFVADMMMKFGLNK